MAILDNFVSLIMAAGDTPSPYAVGTVSAVTAGAAADGNALAAVDRQGADIQCAYGAHYTPAVGHVVLMARIGPQFVILCRLIGTPPSH